MPAPRPMARKPSDIGTAPGAICPHEAAAWPEQLPPVQDALPEAVTLMLSRLVSWASQACRSVMWTYWPLQKSATPPVQSVLQPPV